MSPSCPPPPLHPYRLFHLCARLRLRFSPPSPSTTDDYYNLLLSSPHPTPAPTITPLRAPEVSATPNLLPPPIETSAKGPDNKVLFSRALEGPSPRVRGLRRAEKGLSRPTEPDNCCMSGCVNCVWDAYREEVEEWAMERRRREGMHVGGPGESGDCGSEVDEGGGVGDLDAPIGRGFEEMDLNEEGMFEGVPVGIREFMNTEKRLKERRRGARVVV